MNKNIIINKKNQKQETTQILPPLNIKQQIFYFNGINEYHHSDSESESESDSDNIDSDSDIDINKDNSSVDLESDISYISYSDSITSSDSDKDGIYYSSDDSISEDIVNDNKKKINGAGFKIIYGMNDISLSINKKKKKNKKSKKINIYDNYYSNEDEDNILKNSKLINYMKNK